MQAKVTVGLAAFFTVVAVVSCDNPTAQQAFENQEAHVAVYALNGTPASVPAAMTIRVPAAVIVAANFAFDVAFDLNASNQVVIHSPRAIASQLASVQRVGFQLTTQPFDAVTTAPTQGYAYDTSFVVPAAQTVLVDVVDPSCFGLISGSSIRAKFAIDSVSLTKRVMFVHVLSDPNCGFKTLTTGVPKG